MQVRNNITKVLTSLLVALVVTVFSADAVKAQSDQGALVAGKPSKSMKSKMQRQKMYQDEMYDDMDAGSDWTENLKGKIKRGGGLTWQSNDGTYKMRFRLRGQFRATVSDKDGEDNTTTEWDIPRLRMVWDGNAIVPWFKYKLQIDASDGDAELRDLKLKLAYNKMYTPVFGQYKVPFNREQLNSSADLQFVDRSIINVFSFGRDRGVSLAGKYDRMLGYYIGAFQGEGRNATEGDQNEKDSSFLWAGRIMVNPFSTGLKIMPNFARDIRMQIGAGLAYLETDLTYTPADSETPASATPFDATDSRVFDVRSRDLVGAKSVTMTAWTADVSLVHPIANLEAEYIGMWSDPSGRYADATATDGFSDKIYDYGFRVQGAFFIVPKTFETGARFARITYDEDLPYGGDNCVSTEWTGGINYYISKDHRLKFQADYSRITDEDPFGVETDENRFRAQFQAYF